MALTPAKKYQAALAGLLGHSQGRDAAQKRFVAGAISPLVLYMAVFTLLPMVWGLALAFFEYSARRSGGRLLGLGGDNPFVGLQNFQAMLDFSREAPLEVRLFHIGVKTTLLFAFLVLPLNFAVTLPLAVLIESVHSRLKGIFRTIFFLPVLAPAVGVAIMWGYVFHPQRGLLNGIRTLIGGTYVATAWLRDPGLMFLGIPIALFAVIVAYLWQDLGYNLVIFIAALQSIPESIKDAARIDGVSPWQMFWRITIPLLKPTILLTAILTMISSFQVFDIIQVMTEGGPSDQTQVLVLNIYDYAFRFQRMGWAAAVSVVLFLMIFSFSIIQNRLLQTEWEY
ncbi:MAG: sugar ABC transporter permease [Anaerolineales bacterium]|nr:MAG: sugar ABC transporter permease [Anaerolineales bacterium]